MSQLMRMKKRMNWRNVALALVSLLLISAYVKHVPALAQHTMSQLMRMKKRMNWRNVALALVSLLLISAYVNIVVQSDSSTLIWERSSSGGDDVIEKADEMEQRTVNMRLACSQYPVRRQLKAGLTGKRLFYISEKYSLSYCRVAKVGSTFWTQVFMTLAGVDTPEEKKSKSFFDVPRDEAHNEMKKHSELTMDFHDKRVHETTSFLVTRNPYSRLFSSYIDQIYLPNKWEHAAKMVNEKKRQQCGSDVTFEEFLASICNRVMTKGIMDLHWAPIFSICLPCESNVDVLAKQESFNDDADYILDRVGVEQSIRDEVKRAVGESLYETTIPTMVHTYVTKGHNIKEGCISESELAEKIWSAFQIQGYIHNDIKFPAISFKTISKNDIERVLTKKVLDAIGKRRLTSEERDEQRHAWKVHFWKTVSLETLQKVQDAYYEDFFVFQYDLDPKTM